MVRTLARTIRPTLAILAALGGPVGLGAQEAMLSGQVSSASQVLAAARVYAYQLADASLAESVTDLSGDFRFEELPAGLYKIIAFKPGFVPTVALLTRASAQAAQFLDIRLSPLDESSSASTSDFWTVRRRIPADVLREIDLLDAVDGWSREAVPPARLVRAQMQAVTGVDSTLDGANSQMTGGHVDFAGAVRDLTIGVTGNYMQVQPGGSLATGTDGTSRVVAVDLEDGSTNSIRVTSADNQLIRDEANPTSIAFESHAVSYSREGNESLATVTARYTAESNFYRSGNFGPVALPEASRSWRLEGRYATSVSRRSRVEAGFRYRETEAEAASARFWLPQERVEVFGKSGLQASPAVLVEYGLYSTLRDGSLSLMPQGSLVLRLAEDWRATGTFSQKVHEDLEELPFLQDFTSAHYKDYAGCDQAAEHCYKVVFSRLDGDEEKMSLGAVHRGFDETLQLHFDRDFFNQDENIFLVPGDSVPEIQIGVNQRLAPGILSRFESNIGRGGGGVLWAGDRPRPYSNDVRYLVTSLDTQFKATATGVFVAYHQLEQRLEPLRRRDAERLVEIEKLQLVVTQQLDVLHRLASDLAVQLNMELSRGLRPELAEADPDELHGRITGGLAVSF
jgi:hypothetical protein